MYYFYFFFDFFFQMTKNLAVFDFDHTIINGNSDLEIMRLLEQKNIPQRVKELHKSDGWTVFMQAIFELLDKHGVKEDAIKDLITNLPAVPGMPELIKTLNEKFNCDIIIISDSNSYFIDSWIDANNLKDNILKTFTNPAHFENHLLKIKMYHLQNSCKLSTKNLCKGQIMEDFVQDQLKNGSSYDRVLYFGDGLNDFCPILRLKENDLACVRKNYKCVGLVKKALDGQYKDDDGVSRVVLSHVFIWENAFEIIDYMQKLST